MSAWTPGVRDGLVVPPSTAPPFEAPLEAVGVNVIVSVPPEVSGWFADRGHVAVQGLVDDVGIEATLVPAGDGRHRLYLNREMRGAAGLDVGDVAQVTLWRDESAREPDPPSDLVDALRAAGLLVAFEQWPPSHRREYIVAIEDARRPRTRARRIARTVDATRARHGS